MKRNPVLWILLAVLCQAYSAAKADDGQGQSIRLVILGDTSFGESYQDRRAGKGRENVLRTRGYDYMIQAFAAFLTDADFTVANLETAVTDKFPSPFEGDKKYLHYADVEKTPLYLAKYGIDLVSLANNHALDFGTLGLQQTLELLSARKIDSCGVGPNATMAKRPYVKRFDIANQQVHIAILCMFEYRERYEEKYHYYATPDRAGVNALSVAEIGSIVDELRRDYPNLFVIAYPHWGKNYRWASKNQRIQAHAMIDVGVDLVIGHGAHLIQEIERYEERWIAYGLGNFVFGSPGRYRKKKAHPYGAIAVLLLSPDVNGVAKQFRLYPIFTDNRVTNYRSRFVTEAEFEEVRALLRSRNGLAGHFDALVRSGADEHGFFLELSMEP
jgi:poly-gamma-glutamate capsule biosynthesis protein CapA/YwtB (metallophosphatase superfamily)